jgi:hypothetical protein
VRFDPSIKVTDALELGAAYLECDHAPLRLVERRPRGRVVAQRQPALVQSLRLADPRVEGRHLGLRLVHGRAQQSRVLHILQVHDHAPRIADELCDALARIRDVLVRRKLPEASVAVSCDSSVSRAAVASTMRASIAGETCSAFTSAYLGK